MHLDGFVILDFYNLFLAARRIKSCANIVRGVKLNYIRKQLQTVRNSLGLITFDFRFSGYSNSEIQGLISCM